MAKIKTKIKSKGKEKSPAKKAATKKVVAKADTVLTLTKLVAPMHDLHGKIAAFQAQIAETNKLLAGMESRITLYAKDNLKDDEKLALTDGDNTVEISARRNSTSITATPKKISKLLEKVKEGLTNELMGFSITGLKKYLSPKQINKIAESVAGARSISYK